MKKLLRLAAGATVSMSLLGAGVVSAQTGTIGTTGQGSYNKVSSKTSSSLSVSNDNNVGGTNNNPQESKTGSVKVDGNTTSDGAQSGTASNDSTLNASVTVDNTSSTDGVTTTAPSDDASGSISLTGQGSTNEVTSSDKTTTNVDNQNCLNFTNNNSQSASSGSVSENGNTTAGSAVSGDANNTSNTTITYSVDN